MINSPYNQQPYNRQTQPRQPYQRQSGVSSGLGQRQPQSCPTGYRYDTLQAKCVAVNQPQPMPPPQRIGQQLQQPVQQQSYQMQPMQQMQQPQQQQQPTQGLPKPNQLSPYAQLIAQAIDLNPSPYNQPPPQPVQQQPMQQYRPMPEYRPMIQQGFPQQPINQYVAQDMRSRRLRELLMGGR